MVDLILFCASGIILLVMVILFVAGLYLSLDDSHNLVYFKYCNYGTDYYVKCKKSELRFYRRKHLVFKGRYERIWYDLSHVTWITRREYEEAIK